MSNIKNFINTRPTLKRYLLSSVSTFLTTFLGILSIEIGKWDGSVFTWSLIGSLIVTAIRAGVKAVIEGIAGQHADLPTTQA